MARAGIEGNVKVNEVLQSTPVVGVLSMVALMLLGACDLFEGCSYRAIIACDGMSF